MALKITGGVANQPNVPQIQLGWGSHSGWFEVSIVEDAERVISSPSTTEGTTQDRLYDVSTAGQIAQDYIIEEYLQPRPAGSPKPVITITENGGVELDGNLLKSIEDGTEETLTFTTPQRTLSLAIKGQIRTMGPETQIHKSFVAGSLAHHCEDSVSSRIVGASTDMLPIFEDYGSSNSSGSYTRNADCWAYDIRDSLTCISPWNSSNAHQKAGTAITPRHILGAAHYEYGVGTVVRFVTADNLTIERTIIGKKRHPEYSPHYPDITIYLLNSDLPTSIIPCKMLPADYEDYLPTGPKWVAALCLDQEEKALVADLNYFDADYVGFRYPNLANEQTLYNDLVIGDSGNPAFLIINDELVCLTVWTFGGAGRGTFLTPQIPVMNQMIADLDDDSSINTGYTIQTADLSGFTDFS